MPNLLHTPTNPTMARARLIRDSIGLALALSLFGTAQVCRASGKVIHVNLGTFTGDEKLAPAVADTLLTDLAKSSRISVSRSHATARQGQAGGSCVLTGSCVVYNGAVAINARVVDAATGRTLPGAAESVTGPKSEVFTLVHSLAGKLTARVTGESPRGFHTVSSIPRLTSGRTVSMTEIGERVEIGDSENPVGTSVAEGYTGLIIDARGLSLDRSMSPSIRRKGGSVVWNGGEASPDYVISSGIVSYSMTIQGALEQQRAGARPLVLRAVARHETPFPSDPYIEDADAEALLHAAKRDGFLKKYHVIFVIGRKADD
jgi:TolB-like protein